VRLATRVPGESGGVGDVVVSGMQVLGFDVRRREILCGGLEIALPTGSEAKGLSAGTVTFTPYLAYGRGFGRTIVQAWSGVALPADSDKAPRLLRYALGLSQSLGPARWSC
jgi:hypothetical protein